MHKEITPAAHAAIDYICQNDEVFGKLIKKMSVVRSVQTMLQEGRFDLVKLHKEGDLRDILNAFL